MVLPAFITIKASNHVDKIKKTAKKKPDIKRWLLSFLNLFSKKSMALPMYMTGWGNIAGSPNIKSRIKAARIMYH